MAFRGRPYEDAVASHRDFLESRTLVELLELARSTPDPRDDALVTKVGDIRTRIEGIRGELVTQRRELERVARRTGSLADLVREATSRFSSRRSYFPEDFHLPEAIRTLLDEDSSPAEVIEVMESAHVKEPILVSYEDGALEGWFAEISSEFDLELGSTTIHTHTEVESEITESEIVVTDEEGRVIHRRITRRGGD